MKKCSCPICLKQDFLNRPLVRDKEVCAAYYRLQVTGSLPEDGCNFQQEMMTASEVIPRVVK